MAILGNVSTPVLTGESARRFLEAKECIALWKSQNYGIQEERKTGMYAGRAGYSSIV